MNLEKSLAAFNEAKKFMAGGGRFKSDGTTDAIDRPTILTNRRAGTLRCTSLVA